VGGEVDGVWDLGRGDLRKRTGKVVCGNLIGWDEGFGDEVLGPGVEDVVVLGQVGGVVGALGVG
jgi:hypothetical protein